MISRIILTCCWIALMYIPCNGQYNAISFLALPDGFKLMVDGIDKHKYKVVYLNAANDKVWEKSINYEHGFLKGKIFAVAAPDGNTFYVGEYHPKGFYDKKHYVSVFTKEGTEKKFTVDGKEDFGKSLTTIFCDNDFLYYMASDNGDERGKKLSKEKVILSQFSKTDFKHRRIIPELPVLEDGDNVIFWSIIGQRRDEKIFASKTMDSKAGKNKFTIASINSEGKAVSTKVIETTFAGGKFTRASVTQPQDSWFSVQQYLDYLTAYSSQMQGLARTVCNDGAQGHIVYDMKNDSFYVFGLFGPSPLKQIGTVYEGFYVHKYNGKCEEQWKLQQPAHKDLMDENFFRIHATPGERYLNLVPGPDNSMRVIIMIKNLAFPYSIDSNGKAKALPKFGGGRT